MAFLDAEETVSGTISVGRIGFELARATVVAIAVAEREPMNFPICRHRFYPPFYGP
jgi:hypothetical protein